MNYQLHLMLSIQQAERDGYSVLADALCAILRAELAANPRGPEETP